MTSKSLWMDIKVAPDAGVLDGVQECDVAVVGSGIAGISTAYELCQRGKSVIVIDRGRICAGMTSRTSAHLAPLCDDLVSEMTKIKGHETTKLFCDSQAAAVDRIEEIQKKEKIDCDFRRLRSLPLCPPAAGPSGHRLCAGRRRGSQKRRGGRR